MQELEQNWAEPLHEYAQFASIIKKLLAYRHQKHVQYEMTQDALESKREQLEELEKSEREARRLEAALGKGRSGITSPPHSPDPDEVTRTGEEQSPSEIHKTSCPRPIYLRILVPILPGGERGRPVWASSMP